MLKECSEIKFSVKIIVLILLQLLYIVVMLLEIASCKQLHIILPKCLNTTYFKDNFSTI